MSETINLTSETIKPLNIRINTHIILLIPGTKAILGGVKSIEITENRPVIDPSIPKFGPHTITGKIHKIRFDKNVLHDLFNKPLSPSSQRQPFDIWVIDRFYENEIESFKRTELNTCWCTSISTVYTSSEFIISDYLEFEAEKIITKEHLTEDEEIIKDIIT
jgi:hypothetical protein